MECSEYECKFGLHGVPCCLGFQTIDEEFLKDPFYRECGIYVGDEPLPELKPNPNLEPLPEPQHSPEFYCHQKSESDALIKNS